MGARDLLPVSRPYGAHRVFRCMHFVGGVCVCVLCIRPYCGGGTSKPFVSVLCDNSVNVLWVLCVERVCGVWMYLCVCVLYVYVL